ncbi:MAG: hypothetical protein U1E73_14130 [Planctomycetota bacterium]
MKKAVPVRSGGRNGAASRSASVECSPRSDRSALELDLAKRLLRLARVYISDSIDPGEQGGAPDRGVRRAIGLLLGGWCSGDLQPLVEALEDRQRLIARNCELEDSLEENSDSLEKNLRTIAGRSGHPAIGKFPVQKVPCDLAHERRRHERARLDLKPLLGAHRSGAIQNGAEGEA